MDHQDNLATPKRHCKYSPTSSWSQPLCFFLSSSSHHFSTCSSFHVISLCQWLVNQTRELIQLYFSVKYKTLYILNMKEWRWELAWLLFSWMSSFPQYAVQAYQCSHLDNTGMKMRNLIRQGHIKSLIMTSYPSPASHLYDSWLLGVFIEKCRTTIKPIWAALAA